MLSDLNSQIGTNLALASVAVAFALLIFFLVARAWRKRGSRGFVRSGRGRQPRLAVVDTTTVDQRRRLILVRRDDVEHLILTGGPSDLVVESRIGAARPIAGGSGEVPAGAVPLGIDAADSLSGDVRAEAEAESVHADAATRESADPVQAVPAKPAAAAAPELDVEQLFDNNRDRVFGQPQPDRAPDRTAASGEGRFETGDGANSDYGQRETMPDGQETAKARASVVRFEDFLDTEAENDLAQVRPNEPVVRQTADAAPDPTDDVRSQTGSGTPSAHDPSRPNDDRVLNEEMSRLLSELSRNR